MVSVIFAVLKDLRYFLAFYGFALALFGLIYTLLLVSPDGGEEEYSGISVWFGYFIMSFRASIGDFPVGTIN